VDDLILVLLGAMAAAIAVAFAIFVAVSILAATAVGAAVWALFEGAGAFSGSFAKSIRDRGGERRAPRAPEPAFELYVLGQLFADFRFSLSHAGGVLAEVRGKLGTFAAKWSEGVTIPLSIGAIVGGYIGTVVAAVIGVLAGAFVGLVVVLASGVSWLLIWGLRLADAVRRRIRHASYECPVDHERFALPVYVCPACGAEHERLVPGRWGILKRECACGKTALPTAVINGRQRVPQKCPSGHPMSGFLGFAENLPVAIVGGPSSGKSTFLAGALIELDDPAAGVSLEPLSESRDAYSQLVSAMRSGLPPRKTTDERAPALVAEVQGAGRSRALYAYDVAGEVYGAEDKVRGLQFLARSAGIVLLVDPFSIPRVAADRAEELASFAQQVLPSSEDPMRVFERLLATLKESGAELDELPIAVIVAKADACGIEREIEQLAAAGAERAPRDWLEANGAGNLVRAIDGSFKQVAWFSTSALGRMPSPENSKAFVPRGALAPLLWILQRRNVHTAKTTGTATHTAQSLTGTATDFPLPTPAARAWRATATATTAAGALIAIIIVLATLIPANTTASTNLIAEQVGTAEAASSPGEDADASGADTNAEQDPHTTSAAVKKVLARYRADFSNERIGGLEGLFAPGLLRRNGPGPVEGRAKALHTYRTQFSQLRHPRYTLSNIRVRQEQEGATATANYQITSQNGTVGGTIRFDLNGAGEIKRITVHPRP
jgi:hypothetical protein